MSITQALELVEAARQRLAAYALHTDSPEPIMVEVADLLDAVHAALLPREGV